MSSGYDVIIGAERQGSGGQERVATPASWPGLITGHPRLCFHAEGRRGCPANERGHDGGTPNMLSLPRHP